MKNRLEWLDIAKGIGILLVVLGHCLHHQGTTFHLIFTFHMPLFVMLSGYTFSDKGSFSVLVKNKARTLLIPFFCFFMLGLVITLIIPQWRQGLTWAGIKADLWLADPNAVHNSSIWFLICLFFVILLFYWINKLPAGLRFLSLLVIWSAGIWYSENIFPFMGYGRLPLNLDVVPIAIVFFALGYYAKVYGVLNEWNQHSTYKVLMAIGAFAGMCVVYKHNGYVNMHGLAFGSSELYLLGGILGTVGVVVISNILSSTQLWVGRWIKNVLSWYGRHSLLVLGMQSVLIRLYIVVMNQVFHKQLALYQFSWKHTVLSAVLVGFVFCPVGCIIIDWIKAKVINKREII